MITTANKFYNVLEAHGTRDALDMGVAWYPEAWRVCKGIAIAYRVSPERVAAIVAVTSPRARWSVNVEAAAGIVQDSRLPAGDRRESYGIMHGNAAKGMRAATDRYYRQHVTGPKVTNFYANLIGDTDVITVDSIMAQAAGYNSNVTRQVRSSVERGVRTIAEMFSVSNRDAQAAIWCAYRGSAA